MTLAADLKSVGDGSDLDVAAMKEEQFTGYSRSLGAWVALELHFEGRTRTPIGCLMDACLNRRLRHD